jgi:hypothetical protein
VSLDRLHEEGSDVTSGEYRLQRLEIIEGNPVGVGQQGPEPLPEDFVAVERERTGGKPVEGLLAVHQPGAPRGIARELDGSLHGLCAGIAEEGLLDGVGQRREQTFRQHAGQQGDAELKHARKSGIENVAQGLHDLRMISPHAEHPKAREQVEVAPPLGIEEVCPLGAHVVAVEAEGAQHLHQLGIEVLVVEVEPLPCPLLQQLTNPSRHRSSTPHLGQATRGRAGPPCPMASR